MVEFLSLSPALFESHEVHPACAAETPRATHTPQPPPPADSRITAHGIISRPDSGAVCTVHHAPAARSREPREMSQTETHTRHWQTHIVVLNLY